MLEHFIIFALIHNVLEFVSMQMWCNVRNVNYNLYYNICLSKIDKYVEQSLLIAYRYNECHSQSFSLIPRIELFQMSGQYLLMYVDICGVRTCTCQPNWNILYLFWSISRTSINHDPSESARTFYTTRLYVRDWLGIIFKYTQNFCNDI